MTAPNVFRRFADDLDPDRFDDGLVELDADTLGELRDVAAMVARADAKAAKVRPRLVRSAHARANGRQH